MSCWESNIAWRYLFSKKGHSAINIVSGVSAVAVAVVTAAMLCVLSVLNGFESLVECFFSEFDAELRITAVEGKYFSVSSEAVRELRDLDYVQVVSEQIKEEALVQYDNHQVAVTLLGVDDAFAELANVRQLVVSGHYELYDGTFERTVIGQGLATLLGYNPNVMSGLHLYAPKRSGRVNLMRADESLNEGVAFVSGVFAVNQVSYDDSYLIVSLPMARHLFDYQEDEVSALGLKIDQSVTSLSRAQREIQSLLGTQYKVENRAQQQGDFFRIVKVEKLLTMILLVFILLIASFNVISSLSMLILDKSESIAILHAMGASESQIRRVFLLEGWLISMLGATVGVAVGLVVCLLQEHFGLLKLGSGTEYVISAYPVVVDWKDVLFVMLTVIVLGFAAAFIPSKKIRCV